MSYIDGFVIAVPTAKKQEYIEHAKLGDSVFMGFKETRDAGMSKMMSDDFKDERMDPNKNPAPFDGKRLIYGGFKPIVEL